MFVALSLVIVTLFVSGGVEAGKADMGCINACADYSIALGFCRGSFEFNRTSDFTPHPKYLNDAKTVRSTNSY